MFPWGLGSLAPLEPSLLGGAASAGDLLLLGSVARAGAGAGAGTRTRGGITARLRRWPLGNQVSIWPRSGPSFPIPALIRGIARYYSFHNNIPLRGLRRDPAMGRVGEWVGGPGHAVSPCCAVTACGSPRAPHTWGRQAQTPAGPGCRGDCQIPASSKCPCPACSVPTEHPGGTQPANSWGWGQGWMALSQA